jgi:hypothetical protein
MQSDTTDLLLRERTRRPRKRAADRLMTLIWSSALKNAYETFVTEAKRISELYADLFKQATKQFEDLMLFWKTLRQTPSALTQPPIPVARSPPQVAASPAALCTASDGRHGQGDREPSGPTGQGQATKPYSAPRATGHRTHPTGRTSVQAGHARRSAWPWWLAARSPRQGAEPRWWVLPDGGFSTSGPSPKPLRGPLIGYPQRYPTEVSRHKLRNCWCFRADVRVVETIDLCGGPVGIGRARGRRRFRS